MVHAKKDPTEVFHREKGTVKESEERGHAHVVLEAHDHLAVVGGEEGHERLGDLPGLHGCLYLVSFDSAKGDVRLV